MTRRQCDTPLPWPTLLAYWLGELDLDDEQRVEEHYLGCDYCSDRLERLTVWAKRIRVLTRESGINMVIDDAFTDRLMRDGLRVREYRVQANGSVDCTVAPEDDFVVARLEAPLGDAARIDLVYTDSANDTPMRQEDVPFVPASGCVVLALRIAALRALPKSTIQLRLLAVDKSGEQTLGEYTFNHRPYTSRKS